MNRVGDYRLIATIGRGGMAEVFLALASGPHGFQKLFVLKVLRAELATDPDFVEMFLAEARIAALLAHPNVVQTYEVGKDDERPFIAMEYLEGQPFSALVGRVGRDALPMELSVYVLVELLKALEYAHRATELDGTALGIVHRDVSPHNVFVTYSGQVKLLDFGIAKLARSSVLTQHGVLKGKVGYMAPEQAMGTPLDLRADIFAVGVMLWEALARKRLVLPTDDDSFVLKRRMAGEDPPPDSARASEAALVGICRRAMARERSERFESAAAMRVELEAWLGNRPSLGNELAIVIERAFERERSQIRRLVEEQVAASARKTELSIPEVPSPSSERGIHAAAREPAPASALASVHPSARPTVSAKMQASGLHWSRVALLVGVGVVAVGIAAALRPKATISHTEPPVAPHETGASATPELVRIRVQLTPPGGSLELDGTPVATPVDAHFPRDGKHHRLRATAPGYRTMDRELQFEADLVVDLALETETAAPPKVADASTERSPSGKSATTKKQPTRPPASSLGIDEKDPYAK